MAVPVLREIPAESIDASPYQHRKFFSPEKLEELAKSIERDGLVEPIVVRAQNGRFELIAGERRVRATLLLGPDRTVLARIADVDDLEARRMCIIENVQREDLSEIERIEATIELIDVELLEDAEYAALGAAPKDRVKTLLGQLNSAATNAAAGRSISAKAETLTHKYVCSVERLFASLPKPIGWRSFYEHDLPLATTLDPTVRDWAIANRLNKLQTTELQSLKSNAPNAFETLKKSAKADGTITVAPVDLGLHGIAPVNLAELSGRELREVRRQETAPILGAHVAYNSGENEWYTPPEYIEAARATMGSIDCDPASSAKANETVQAAVYYNAQDDGLSQTWRGSVWLNPPYAPPLIDKFSQAAGDKFDAGEFSQACILVNNATETIWFRRLLSSAAALCFLSSRVRFLDPQGNPGAPLQGQIVLYMGTRRDAFKQHFESFGPVCPTLWTAPS